MQRQRSSYRILLPVLGALSFPACGDDGATDGTDGTDGTGTTSATGEASSNEPGTTGTPTSTTTTTTATTSTATVASDTMTTSAEVSTSSETSAESSSGTSDADSSGETSTSTGGEVEVCAPELGLYANDDCTTLAEGIESYEPQYKLWSDGLVKFRYVFLPDTIDSSDPDYWDFPVGTVMWKHFETPAGLRLETRRIEKMSDDVGPSAWMFETFEWNAAGDAVEAVPIGAENVLGTDHDIPAIADCAQCHNGGQVGMVGTATHDAVLGFGALQLNHEDSDVTLASLVADNLLSVPVALADAAIPGTPTDEAALGTLHANCGHCHGGDAPSGGMRLFVTVGLEAMTDSATYIDTVDVEIGPSPVMGIPDLRVAPGDPDGSAVSWRMGQRDGGGFGSAQMPPLATEVVDDAGVAAVDAWIESLPN